MPGRKERAAMTAAAPRRAAQAWSGLAAGNPVATMIDTLLRGTGQVMFQNNPLTGLIFLAGIFVNSRISALFALLGWALGALTAWTVGASGIAVFHGLYGFNSVLCGIALGGLFFVLTWRSAICALVAAIIAALVFAAISVFLAPIGMPALTAPFVLVAWIFLLAKAGFKALVPVGLADVGTAEATLEGYRTGGAGPEAPVRDRAR
jgi:urea transporter